LTPTLASPDKATIRKFFDGIAPRYDRINTLLSLRLDESWRRKAVDLILDVGATHASPLQTILDLGVGTGKFLEAFLGEREWQRAVGVDFSEEMLHLAEKQLPSTCELVQADIHDLPFEGESFDLIVSSFTLRSVKDRAHFFAEVRRILKPRGRVAFLCLTRPTSFWMRLLYAPYLKIYLPWVGGAISTDREAYRFLSESIQAFPSPEEIGKELETSGLRSVRFSPFTFGISTLIQAEK
jgi:demethylmenaquinone methyltransferase/2-methoxy-6-polyprenyl-1,4-benzoquinol methylase